MHATVDYGNGCEAPLRFSLTGAKVPGLLPSGRDGFPAIGGYMLVQCRKCPRCLKLRAKLWRERAVHETVTANRTWFITFTVSPDHRYRLSLLAGSSEWSALWERVSAELTLSLKRLRKAGHAFRYLAVGEAHKDGFPHVHMLLHERGAAITKRQIEAEWRLGFSRVKLIVGEPARAAAYVAKYLAKDAASRVRASREYGAWRTANAVLTDNLMKMRCENTPPQKGEPPVWVFNLEDGASNASDDDTCGIPF
jgi:hypothetical protein